ncbi:hypothetical protein V6N13_144314 [Hibiscus sabdariffa]
MFEKIALVITKAQKLRFKALELLVKKLLNQTEAAEFLVALSEVDKGFNNFNASAAAAVRISSQTCHSKG